MAQYKSKRKRCSRCGEAKLPSQFNKSNCRPGGLQNYCAVCQHDLYQEQKAGLLEKAQSEVGNVV